MPAPKHTYGEWVTLPPLKAGKHWKVGVRGTLAGHPLAGKEVTWLIASIDNGAPGDTLDTEAANARLIAAAPTLLAAVEEALDTLTVAIEAIALDPETAAHAVKHHRVLELLRKAIAKAKGV